LVAIVPGPDASQQNGRFVLPLSQVCFQRGVGAILEKGEVVCCGFTEENMADAGQIVGSVPPWRFPSAIRPTSEP
jgi:hypothetical protein